MVNRKNEFDIILPEWLGKSGIREDAEATVELAVSIAKLMKMNETKILMIKQMIQFANGNIETIIDVLNNNIIKEFVKTPLEEGMNKVTTRIFVGFPETPIGRINAHLGGIAFQMREYLSNKDKYDKSDLTRKQSVINTGFV